MNKAELALILRESTGNDLKPSDFNAVSNLNEIPDRLIKNLYNIDNSARYDLLEYYASPDNSGYLRRFMHDVLLGNAKASSWMKGRVLVPLASFGDKLTISLEEVYIGLGSIPLFVVSPTYDQWLTQSTFNGSLVKVEKNSTYKSSKIEGFADLGLQTKYQEILQTNQHLSHRRHLANLISSYLVSKQKLKVVFEKGDLADVAPISQWTEDTHKAFEGLQKEQKLNDWTEGVVPGYLGDDSLYE